MLAIHWKPCREDRVPLHKQIVAYITGKIASGEWPVGCKLPSQRLLAEIFGVNRSTLINALDELCADGLLAGRQGSGIRIANNTWSLLTAARPVNWDAYVDNGVQLPNYPVIQEINRAEFLPGVIRLGTGELSPAFYPQEIMTELMHNLPAKIPSLGYEEPQGLFFLRQQISSYLHTHGIYTTPASILIVSGALQALQLISFSLLPPQAAVLLETPSYLFSLRLLQSMHITVRGLPMDSAGLKTSAISGQIRPNQPALLYTIPCFHNPTGISMTAKRRQELLALCRQKQLPIIEDDVYRELWLDSPPPPPLKALDKEGLILYVGSLSKTLSPGLRIGWIAGPEPVIARLADIKMQFDYGSSSLSQWLATEWLAGDFYRCHLENVRRQLKIRRDTMCKILEDHYTGLATWDIPAGGFYVWLKLNRPASLAKLFKAALKNGLLLNPGNLYDPFSQQHLRLSYAYAGLAEIEAGLLRLKTLLRNLLK
ncbi:transcription regulator hth gntr [Lucifera butyrica]|uniref:Transcription regulator hth gntr n=1 Tax=Lucifera butyrica TaxID=1351585 RepID=A0A498RC83_9FIRM|nr:PLP-dependent aminotransferase family protein [Lucifera butyrica]VBB06758.1 transcription regulator hth gntr [Lucifera butyrica]